MSLCGPRAVAHLTGQDYREVVAFIEDRRGRNGRHRPIRAGTDVDEIRAALLAAGHVPVCAFNGERIRFTRLAEFGLTGAWLLHYVDHFLAARSGAELGRLAGRDPYGIIVAGWQILRID